MTVQEAIKSTLHYSLVLALGLCLGYGALQGYKWLTTPAIVVVGDYSEHLILSEKPVIMYGVDWCPSCKNARAYFSKNNIEYTEFNPEKNPDAQERFSQLDVNAYPVIIIGNKRIIGLDIQEINLALSENNIKI